ncbi:MAG: hypothetical protein L0G99_06520 [Propionibacteriales bacterium]|nr:hypothetical protein [Propionibacteriales bacterium]
MKESGLGDSTECYTPEAAYKYRNQEYKECEGTQIRDKNGVTIGAVDEVRSCGEPPKRPKDAKPAEAEEAGEPVYTAEEVAYMAAAELSLPKMKIAMGPDPSWNEWNSAVIGHPYWFWADSPTSIPTVSQNAGPLTVSLDARLKGIGFEMGNGQRISCPSGGSRYSRTSTKPGTKSPDCGYTFTAKGTYQVTGTANWEITWRVNDESGTIMMSSEAARSVPVIELQSVNVDPPR